MKVLHAAALLSPPSGVLTQMEWEQAAAVQLGLDWTVKMYCPHGSVPESGLVRFSDSIESKMFSPLEKAIAWAVFRREYYRWLLSERTHYDVLLLRYYVHDPFQLAFLRRVNRPVFLVHHALECPELALGTGLGGRARAMAEGLLGPFAIRQASGIVGVTQEIAEYESQRAGISAESAIILPNGVLYSDNVAEDRRGSVIELLFVASGFAAWHGLDLLLEAMRNSRQEFVLHVVGNVSDMDLAMAGTDPRVICHGRLDHKAISEIAARCHLGLSSFALFRQQMTQACTLKVREYLMLGLPVYAGYREVLPDSFSYYRNGPCEVDAMLTFARSVMNVSRNDVAEAARPYIDKCMLLGNLYDALLSRVATRA